MENKFKFRLVADPARSAAFNMAVDELLMKKGRPTLRFYRWQRPAVTVGYFEDVSKTALRFARQGENVEVVRRITGGGAVRHGEDLTFSLVLCVPSPFFASDVKSSYLKINEAVRMGLRGEYPSMDYADCKTVPSQTSRQRERVCFDAPSCYDLLLNGKKVLGGSQRRRHGVMLHQSTLFLDKPAERTAQSIREGFERVWSVGFEEEPLTQQELNEAARMEKELLADGSRVYLPEGSFLPACPAGRREAIFLS